MLHRTLSEQANAPSFEAKNCGEVSHPKTVGPTESLGEAIPPPSFSNS
jgi:hypothetical protein